jgi:hypothetical protein
MDPYELFTTLDAIGDQMNLDDKLATKRGFWSRIIKKRSMIYKWRGNISSNKKVCAMNLKPDTCNNA